PLTLPTTSRRALSSSSFASSFFASSLVDAVAPRYRSGAKATNPALASRSERPLKKSVKPHHAWRTRTPGPLPFFGTDKNPGTLPSGLLSSIIPMFSHRLGGRCARIGRCAKAFAETAGRPPRERLFGMYFLKPRRPGTSGPFVESCSVRSRGPDLGREILGRARVA